MAVGASMLRDFFALITGKAISYTTGVASGLYQQVRENRLFRKVLTDSYEYGDKIVIAAGLAEGEIICRDPSPAFRDGMEVEVVE